MDGDIHMHEGRDPERNGGGIPHSNQPRGPTYWESAARKTLVDDPVRTWQGAAHTEEAARLAKKAKDLEMAVGSGSITTIDNELNDLKGKIHDLENKIKGMREDS